MTDPMPETPTEPALQTAPDPVVVRWWFLFYVLLMTAGGVTLGLLLGQHRLDVTGWDAFVASVRAAPAAAKLLLLGMYLTVCTTFFPLNTGWIVSAVAMREVAVADGVLPTVALVALVGSAASTVANLNDYHLFNLLLRSRRIARIRHTRLHLRAEAWFARSPFAILLIFNILPIPVDVARMLAATHGYPRLPFAAANFLGRCVRYAVIASVTYALGNLGWVATVALLALAAVFALVRWIFTRQNQRRLSSDNP
jgi:membrane protein YqaA with SNARE-associated domain